MAANEEVEEVFKLFDQDGSGIKIKEIGTVLRSLGLAASEAQLREFRSEAEKKARGSSLVMFTRLYMDKRGKGGGLLGGGPYMDKGGRSKKSWQDSTYVQFVDFLGYVKRMEKVEATRSVDVGKEMEGMKVGLLHFFDKAW